MSCGSARNGLRPGAARAAAQLHRQLGHGAGYSVLEVVRGFEQASGRPVSYKRRPVAAAQCYADPIPGAPAPGVGGTPYPAGDVRRRVALPKRESPRMRDRVIIARMSASRFLFRSALVLALLLVIASLVVPYSALERVHEEFGWIGRGEAWLTSVWPGFDLDHLAAFASLGFLAALAKVRLSGGQAVLSLLALAAVTEILQGLVPGRSPQLADAALDIVGGAMGYLVGCGLVLLVFSRAPRPAS